MEFTLHETLLLYGFTHRRISEQWHSLGRHAIFDVSANHIGDMDAVECWTWLAASLSGVA